MRAAPGDELWQALGDLPSGAYVEAMAASGEGLYVAGRFDSIGGMMATNVAKWNGKSWRPLGSGLSATMIGAVALGNGSVYVGGHITRAGDVPVRHVARWDGTNWHALGTGVEPYSVEALAFQDGDLYVGGRFHAAGGVGATNIAKWDGANWSALGEGVTRWQNCVGGRCELGVVRALAVVADQLYVGGEFDRAGGMPISTLARWDGQHWSAVGNGMPGYNEGVHALAVQGNTLFVGGNLRWVPGIVGPGVARWDGVDWTAVSGADFEGARALVAVGGDLYVAPGFQNPPAMRGIVRWDGVGWSPLGSGLDGAASELASNGRDLFVAGPFSQAGGKAAQRLALWHIPHALGITHQAGQVTVSWPATGSNLVLEASPSLPASTWTAAPGPPANVGDHLVVTNRAAESTQFYRLRRK